MTYLNHVTLNTAHYKKAYLNDTDKKLFFMYNRYFSPALDDVVDFIDNTKLSISSEQHGYIATIYEKKDENLIPLISTAGANEIVTAKELWKNLHQSTFSKIMTNINDMPEIPYVADRIEFPTPTLLKISNWTGDFTRILGFYMLFPEKMKEVIK